MYGSGDCGESADYKEFGDSSEYNDSCDYIISCGPSQKCESVFLLFCSIYCEFGELGDSDDLLNLIILVSLMIQSILVDLVILVYDEPGYSGESVDCGKSGGSEVW